MAHLKELRSDFRDSDKASLSLRLGGYIPTVCSLDDYIQMGQATIRHTITFDLLLPKTERTEAGRFDEYRHSGDSILPAFSGAEHLLTTVLPDEHRHLINLDCRDHRFVIWRSDRKAEVDKYEELPVFITDIEILKAHEGKRENSGDKVFTVEGKALYCDAFVITHHLTVDSRQFDVLLSFVQSQDFKLLDWKRNPHETISEERSIKHLAFYTSVKPKKVTPQLTTAGARYFFTTRQFSSMILFNDEVFPQIKDNFNPRFSKLKNSLEGLVTEHNESQSEQQKFMKWIRFGLIALLLLNFIVLQTLWTQPS